MLWLGGMQKGLIMIVHVPLSRLILMLTLYCWEEKLGEIDLVLHMYEMVNTENI